MFLAINNRQHLFKIATRQLRNYVTFIGQQAAKLMPQTPWLELTLVLTDDTGITTFNEAVMGHCGVTDVITQRYDPLPGEPRGLLGEIVVNVERAWQYGAGAIATTWSPNHELLLYIAHGCDHLSGADDATPSERQRMRRRELNWLAKLEIADDLLTPLPNKDKKIHDCKQ